MTDTTTPYPPVVDRDTWTAQVNELRVREVSTSEWVFPAPEGGHLSYSAFAAVSGSLRWRAGLGQVTPHALRHTAAAIMIDQGADPLHR